MTREATEIEVEVVEIDGVKPVLARSDNAAGLPPQGHWQRRLPRWWPLWVLLGAVALGLALTFGLVIALFIGAALLVWRLIRALLR
jgi:hypothetical protein